MRNLYLILVLTLSLATAQAAPANLPETGQISCSSATGVPIGCTNTGQDGDRKAGVAWPSPRFVVGTGATAGCVTDNLTGLMWMGAPDKLLYTWTNALTSVNSLTLCGFSDWRLPNINELKSLVNNEAVNQDTFLNTQGFSGVQSYYYWSSSTYVANTTIAWVIYMGDGVLVANDKSLSHYVWPVRAGR